MRLWRLDLSVPVFIGATLFDNCVPVEALAEGTWNYEIVRIGANPRE